MIKIFNANDRDFSTAGNIIIEPIKCIEYKKKSLNGWYIEVEIPIKYKEYISKDKLCVVKTKSKLNPQAFRIGEDIECSTRKIKFQADHVMFDAKDYVLLDVRPTEQNGLNALNYINERTDNLSPFSIYSNVENVNTAYFIRKNLLEAWTTIEEKWGGVFDADNWNISFLTSFGNDNGETIVYGKNMQGFDIYEDWSSVCTKLLPVGYDGLLLPETYLESDVQYEKPYTRVVDFQTNLETEEQTEEKLLEELRQNAEAYLEENKVPKVSYTIISNVNQTLEIGDTIKVLHPFVNLFTEVLEYEYDIILEKVKSLTFGNYNRDVKTKFDNIKNSITQINQALSKQEITINTQTNLINMLNKNGYVYIDDNEILILDTLPKENAKNVWRFGLGGIGFSSNGYEGPFETAITMDGKINADFITTGTMAVDRIESLANFINSTNSSISKIELEQGKITSKVSSVEQSVENITKIEGTAEGKNIYIDDASAEPLIDIMLEGESQQATRSGKNLLDNTATTKISNGITFTVNSDGTVLADGTNDTSANSSLVINRYDLSPGTYILNGCPSGGARNTYRLAIQETGSYSILGSIDIGNGSGEFTIDTTTKVQIAIFIQKGLTVNNLLFKPMLREATIADDTYEQYGASPSPDYPSPIENVEGNIEIKVTNGLEETDENYQEQVATFPLSEGQKLMEGSYLTNNGIHHVRKQVVLTGTENWNLYLNKTKTFKLSISPWSYSGVCTHYQGIISSFFDVKAGIYLSGSAMVIISDPRFSTVEEFKTYLAEQYSAGTPVTFEYIMMTNNSKIVEKIVPYTETQQEAWEKLRHFILFKGINNITSTANAKITYVRDNGLSDTYETKRNVKENYYTKSETDSQISQTADSIKESVKAINEQTQEKLATLELANQSLEFATKRTGGNNLIRNSAMINDNNFWLAHAKYPYQESDTPPDSPTEGAYWYCTANSGSYIENQMYVYNSGWQVSELSRKSLLSAQNYFAYTTSNEYWANGKNANENTLSGRVIKLDGRQDYTVSHIFNITEPITLNQNENKMAISYFIKNSIVQGNVCVGLMFLNEADFTEVEKPYSLYEPGIILTPDDLKDLTKIEQIIEIPKKSDFIPVVVSNTAPTDTTKNWLDTTIYLVKKYNSQTSQWEILDTKMSLYNESSREVWTYRYFYGFYYQTPIIYDTAEIKSCYVALTFYPAFAVYTGNVEPTPYKGLYWNNKTTNLVKRAKYNDTTFAEWETLDIPSSLLPTGASLGVELFDYIVPIKGFVEIADLKLEYNTMCTQWTQFPGEVYGKNYKMDEKGFWIQANQNTMFIDEDEILATYKGINIFQINKDLAYFYKIQATESIEIGNYFLKTQQINSKNMLLLY